MGSILEGAPVTDYTTEGSRASRLQRWEKLQTDIEGLAAARFQQALRSVKHTVPCPELKAPHPDTCLHGSMPTGNC